MRVRGVVFWVLAAGLATLPMPATAQTDNRARAMVMYEQSVKLYKEERFPEAAVLLREAYALEPDPVLQYNLARCLERMDDLEGAVTAYDTYLGTAPDDAPHRSAAAARVSQLRMAVAMRRAKAGPPPAAPPSPPPVVVVQEDNELPPGMVAGPPSTDESSPSEPQDSADEAGGITVLDVLPWGIAGAGAIAVGVGLAMGTGASGKADDANDPGLSMAEAQALHDDAESLSSLANVFLISGAVLVAGGVTWGVIRLLDDDDEGASASARLELAPGGVRLRGTF